MQRGVVTPCYQHHHHQHCQVFLTQHMIMLSLNALPNTTNVICGIRALNFMTSSVPLFTSPFLLPAYILIYIYKHIYVHTAIYICVFISVQCKCSKLTEGKLCHATLVTITTSCTVISVPMTQLLARMWKQLLQLNANKCNKHL